jgi:hypothetical protein
MTAASSCPAHLNKPASAAASAASRIRAGTGETWCQLFGSRPSPPVRRSVSMNLKFPLLLLAGAVATATAVVVLTPDPTLQLAPVFPETPAPKPARAPAIASTSSSAPSGPVGTLTVASATADSSIAPAVPLPAAPVDSNFPSSVPPPASMSTSVLALLPGESPAPRTSRPITAASDPQLPPTANSLPAAPVRSLPASFIDAGDGASPAQVAALDRIADDFEREITSIPPADPSPANGTPNSSTPRRPADWNTASRAANERYRQIFGVELYNAWTSQAAKDALEARKHSQLR